MAISDSAAPGHVMLSPATVAMLQTAAHRHARLQAAQPATRPVPRVISLLPLVLQHPGGSGGGAAAHRAPSSSVWGEEGPISIAAALAGSQGQPMANGSTAGGTRQPRGADSRQRPWLRFLTSTQLSQMFASWLAAQADAAAGGKDGPTLLQVATASFCDSLLAGICLTFQSVRRIPCCLQTSRCRHMCRMGRSWH